MFLFLLLDKVHSSTWKFISTPQVWPSFRFPVAADAAAAAAAAARRLLSRGTLKLLCLLLLLPRAAQACLQYFLSQRECSLYTPQGAATYIRSFPIQHMLPNLNFEGYTHRWEWSTLEMSRYCSAVKALGAFLWFKLLYISGCRLLVKLWVSFPMNADFRVAICWCEQPSLPLVVLPPSSTAPPRRPSRRRRRVLQFLRSKRAAYFSYS